MFNRITNGHAEGEQDDLCNRKECSSENDVTDWPSVLECSEDKDKLRDNINDGANERPENVNDPKTDGLGEIETGELLECSDGDEEGDTEDGKAGYPEEL